MCGRGGHAGGDGSEDFLNARDTAGRRARHAVATLAPGSFALVMATGILSIGLHAVLPALSAVLLWLAASCHAVLTVAFAWRLLRFRAEVGADLADPSRAFGFFTFVAGTDVLGTRLALEGRTGAALVLLVVGALAWVVLGYLVPWKAAVNHLGHCPVDRVNGSWFVWVVGSQSVAVLASTLEPVMGTAREELAVVAVLAWSAGLFLYGAVGVLVMLRLTLYRFRPSDLVPSFWVAMGATAISVLAGSRILHLAGTPLIGNMRHLVAGTAVVFWAFGTWLIPALLAGGWWRHVTHRVPLRYEPALWSIVFPLGMYAVATRNLGTTEQLPLVRSVGEAGIWFALGVWTIVFVAMLVHVGRTLVPGSARPDRP